MIIKYLESFNQSIFPFLCTGFTNTVSFDAVGPSSTASGGSGPPTSPLTFSHTCTGANFLLVGISIGTVAADTAFTISSVTYGAQSMTLVPGSTFVTSPGNLSGRIQLYYLLTPASGTNNVTVNYTDTATPSSTETILAGSLSFKNVNQTTPFSDVTMATAFDTYANVTIKSAVGNMVVDVAMNGSRFISSNTTLRFNNNLNNSNFGSNIAASTSVGFPTTTMSYSNVVDGWIIVALSLNAA